MHITILTMGSRGDVQPFIALGVGLQKAGYRVRLASHANFEMAIRDRGLDFALLSGNPQEFLQSERGQAMMQSRNPIVFVRRMAEAINEVLSSVLLESWNACQGTDAIVAGSLATWGIDIAQKLGVPFFFANLQPSSPTSTFPVSSAPKVSKYLERFYNRLTYIVIYQLVWQIFRKPINEFRTHLLDLPSTGKTPLTRMRQQSVPILNAVSPSVVPVPADWLACDHMTGYWFLDRAAGFVPPPALVNFLAAGTPPVYIGFGSMGGEKSKKIAALALSALAETEQRGIFLRGWSGIENADLPDTVFKIDSIPHDWLFPQMACIVHHGGAGTSAATFRAGVPGIIIPFLGDQPFWRDRAFELGVSPPPIDPENLTVQQLTAAISEAIQNPTLRDRAAQLGTQIREENGVSRTVEIIQQEMQST
ncbi:glycosyltransferase family 1 protein [Lusitaniella coriacea LEGE 07157]|uniref:Glycosyltransferase family 1 protein n=1 Tax=Lusitaniella coriacea LEGE 07157 TaxID=945747 RepID=A0A8J7DW91_9CYAN|nr:glycosyltransferase [Lusitaniella coriacea]MBE9116296.1 glycosyltransferase family 1 protein [Lusitaniella coriacea LEGE 07157]